MHFKKLYAVGDGTPNYTWVPKGTPRWLRNPQSQTIAKIRGPREIRDLEQYAVRALLAQLPTPLPIAASQHPLAINSQRTYPAAPQRTHATENRSVGKPVFPRPLARGRPLRHKTTQFLHFRWRHRH